MNILRASCVTKIKTHFSVCTLGDMLVPGRLNNSTLVSEFQDEHEHISSESLPLKFNQNLTDFTCQSEKV